MSNISEIITILKDKAEYKDNKFFIKADDVEELVITKNLSFNFLDALDKELQKNNIYYFDENANACICGHEILLEGTRRYYRENLEERDFYLENTTPYKIELLEYTLIKTSWVEMIKEVASVLLEINPKSIEELKEFRTDWSKQCYFSEVKKTNYREINDGLFVNCNHTALHSCWLIQDLLDFFEIDKANVIMYIHRPSAAEPKDVRAFLLEKRLTKFKEYLFSKYSKTDEQCDKTINNINKYLTPFLTKTSKSYNNMFLFDDYLTMYNYCDKMKTDIKSNAKFSDEQKKILNCYIKWLLEFQKIK